VTFDSANLSYARKTLILPGADHGAVTADPRAIAWIMDLLKQSQPGISDAGIEDDDAPNKK
jgi:hypothetical protein